MSIFRRKKSVDEGVRYEHKILGPLVIEQTILPHSSHVEGAVFSLATITLALTVEGSSRLMVRDYVMGSDIAIEHFKSFLRVSDFTKVDSEFQAQMLFYKDLHFQLGSP